MYRNAVWPLLAIMCVSGAALAQLSDAALAALQLRAKEEGWTFTVGRTLESLQPLEELCGLVVPPSGRIDAPAARSSAKADLPDAFNWQDEVGCPPIRPQRGCGACWAFATVGALECNILIKDGVVVDLSEQWLVSCNQETTPPVLPPNDPTPSWGCNGGWFAHDYHLGLKTDACGGFGAVFEGEFPYVQDEVPCNCPYTHAYTIDSWAFVGPEFDVADVDAIKQAIVTYGPVSAAIYADMTFSSYTGGVFNLGVTAPPNHGIVLVGWDDNLGANGAWRLRNSWYPSWGENGYMWIEYGRSNVGFGACYIDYPGVGPAVGPTITQDPSSGQVIEGRSFVFSVEADAVGLVHYAWEHDGQPVGDDAPVLGLTDVSLDDAGSYACYVTDFLGTSVSAGASLVVIPESAVPVSSAAIVGACIALVLIASHRIRSAVPPLTRRR